jgi:5-formyltetrahydrofolate cyclo-ligase
MTYTRPRIRGEAALLRHRRSHRISLTDRRALRVNDGQECLGTIVPVAVYTVGPVERPCLVFDQHGRRVGRSGGYREALRAGPRRGRA